MPSAFFSADFDPRLTPAREDMAASWLKGKVTAPRYVEPVRHNVLPAFANLYRTPNEKQAIETQLLGGEMVDVFDNNGAWSWVQSVRDGYVGYMQNDHLGKHSDQVQATHRISNISTFIYPENSYKNSPLAALCYGSPVRVLSEKDGMSRLENGFVPTPHLAAAEFHAEEPVAETFRFLGVPYLWGGRTSQGLDCSALIQLVLQACNYKCPRDSDLQEKFLGRPIDRDDVQGGDLVFFRGHVGMMVDDGTLIHANDRAMAVSIDDLDEYTRWRGKNGKTPVKMFKRL
ncbi:MAG: dipeptidyl-peptidase 6 [Alphaproteobacteria bacterium]|nr:dipeptidyl-peptidase 6 [Alphaproteobacteria bacterium]